LANRSQPRLGALSFGSLASNADFFGIQRHLPRLTRPQCRIFRHSALSAPARSPPMPIFSAFSALCPSSLASNADFFGIQRHLPRFARLQCRIFQHSALSASAYSPPMPNFSACEASTRKKLPF